MTVRNPSSRLSSARAGSLRSWVPIDADYGNRSGFDPRFLGDVTVGLPRVDGKRLRAADLLQIGRAHV